MSVFQQIANLNWFDYAIIAIILISTLLSLVRGFFKELISLATWIIGFWVAFRFGRHFASFFEGYISSQAVRTIVGFGLVFIVVVIIGAIFNYLISLLLVKTGLNGTDRIIGMIFGFARGVLLVAILILLFATTSLVQEVWWKKSVLLPHFKVVVDWLQSILPQKFHQLTAIIPKQP